MKTKLLSQIPKSRYLLLLIILISFNTYADVICGSIEGFEFSNGNESVNLIDGRTYTTKDLPDNFYVSLRVNGYSQSVRYEVENLETGEIFKITENSKPYTFPAGNGKWNLGTGTFSLKANLYKYNLGFGKCDSQSIVFSISESCEANAGTLSATSETVILSNGEAMLRATPNGDINIPAGYSKIYVLTSGTGLVIEQVNVEAPEFTVISSGLYTIHTLVYDGNEDSSNYLNLGIVEVGVTTGVDVLNVVGAAGICASLDAAGAPIMVEDCSANAGTLSATSETVILSNGEAMLSATPNGDINIPAGYSKIYVLTSGTGLVIEQVNVEAPEFTVISSGLYTIHTLVYDGNEDSSNYLNLGIVEVGVTTGVDVLNVVGAAGICASLDAAGAPIMVEEEEGCVAYSGSLYSTESINCLENGVTVITAQENEAAVIPKGYQQLFVLTNAFTLTILDVSNTPSFEINRRGFYRIHSLVYNPATLDLSVVVPGETTGFDVAGLIADNGICASLDVKGAVNLVISSRWFCYFFNKYYNKSSSITGKGTKNSSGLDNLVSKYNSYEAFENDFIESNGDSRFYPNPVINNLSVEIELLDDETMNYRVVDIQGRQIMSGTANDLQYGSQTIDASRLNSGMYLVQFVSEYRTITKKIVVKK